LLGLADSGSPVMLNNTDEPPVTDDELWAVTDGGICNPISTWTKRKRTMLAR
jgi:hypothetical protein